MGSDEECALEEIALRAELAAAVLEEGVAGKRRRAVLEWCGSKVPKLRDKCEEE